MEEDESFEIVDISGPNIKKTLVKDAYDETRNVLGTDLTENGLMTRSISSSTMIQFDHYYKRLGYPCPFSYDDILSFEYIIKKIIL